MARGFYRQLTKILKDNGFYKIGNAKGSHEKWQRPEPEHDYIAIIPYNIDSRHTADAILKQAGIDGKV